MASNSKLPEEPCNSETEAETIALRIRQKRSRRVSFADTEITSVHIFNRDEDYDTPPDPKPQPSSQNDASEQENQVIGFFRDLGADSDDFKDSDDDDDEEDGRKSFFRPIGSPSPGSSVPGSATSNDEDNFFGPVSANFIRPGRLSDSAASDDIHEATLDTTAFSMHYRSLAKSDSGGELKTPMAVRLAFEDKTPTHNTNPTDSGSLMSLTEPKMLISMSLLLADQVRSGEDSNDMSIIEENPHKYDYGRLSPTLDALLAESSKDLRADSVAVSANSMSSKGGEVYTLEENGIDHVDLRNGRSTKMDTFGTHADFVSRIKLSEANGGYSSHIPAASDSVDGQIQTPNQLSKVNKEFREDALPRGMENVELTAGNGNVLPNFNSLALPFDGVSQLEPAYQHSSQGLVQQSILNTPNLARHSGLVTPSSKQPGSFLGTEHIKHNDWVSSIQKSDSRFTIPEPSPCPSSLKEGIDKLKCRLSSYSSMNAPLNTVLADISKDLQYKFSNSPTTGLEKQLARADLNRGQKSLLTIESKENESPINICKLGQVKETTGLAKDEEPPHSMLKDTPSRDAFGKLSKVLASPSQLSSSGSQMTQHLFVSENTTEGTLFSSDTDLLADEQEDNPPHLQVESEKNFQSFSRGAVILKRPDNNFPAGPETLRSEPHVSRSTTEPSPQSPSGKESAQHPSMKGPTHSPPRENPTPIPPWRNVTLSALRSAPSQSPYWEEPTQSPFKKELTRCPGEEPIQSPSMKEPIRSPVMREPIRSPVVREPIRSPVVRETIRSPVMKKPIRSPVVSAPIRSPVMKEPIRSPVVSEPIRSPFVREPQSPVVRKPIRSLFINDMSRSPSRKEPMQSPFKLESSYASPENMQPFVGKDLISHKFNSNRHPNDDFNKGLHVSKSPFSEQGAEGSVGRKRRNLGLILEDGDCTDKSPRVQRSPKVHKCENYDPEIMLHQSNKGYSNREKSESATTRKCWTDILVKFSGDTEQLLYPLTSNLNLRVIDVLEDMLVRLMKAKKYETLWSEVQSQKVDCINVGHKRAAEVRLLLYKIVYEKAKLQLMHVKRDKLQSRVQFLSSAIQDFQMLKLNYIHCQSEPGKREIQVDDSHHQSSLVNSEGEQETSRDNVSTMRQELKALDGEIKSLSSFFHTYSKLEGEPISADTISLVDDHLKARRCCRFIRQDLQLWNVDDFETKADHHNILLSYHGYINQRFTVTVDPASNISISHRLNDMKIIKDFPGMDVQVAFGFVLNSDATKKSVDFRSLAQETQVTRSLLCNLLDVVNEVHLARDEIANLMQTSFQSPSAEQLELQLCFLHFKSSRKVALTLDMTCLKSGIYPSEIRPHQIQAAESAAEVVLPESLLAEIRAAAENLESGYTRIVRLCKCISHVVDSHML